MTSVKEKSDGSVFTVRFTLVSSVDAENGWVYFASLVVTSVRKFDE